MSVQDLCILDSPPPWLSLACFSSVEKKKKKLFRIYCEFVIEVQSEYSLGNFFFSSLYYTNGSILHAVIISKQLLF